MKVGWTDKLWRPSDESWLVLVAYLVPFGASDVFSTTNERILNFKMHTTKT